MTTVNASNILVGVPDQLTTGAILSAPVGTQCPTDAVTAPGSDFVSGGYVTSAGVQLTPTTSTKDVKDWSGAVVRRILTDFKGEIKFASLELSYEAACQILGEDYVAKTAKTVQHGTQLALKFGRHLPKPRAWVFNMKDGDTAIRIVVPNGQAMGQNGTITFNADNTIELATTVACLDDGTGESIHIYTDDGVKASA